ncbi:MAG: type IV pili methyl-accepting chemotaxis transducer N-terminal domain-containing protein [Ectothiorhodospiraceae bacterium]|nr:type IV pili methyl-accepting chemotaxis transducer N-terminal domain-containing protein [Ectothiorhodospiraceae bacterium]
MTTHHEQSVLLRTGAILAGIALLALISMVSTIVIAETARGDAAAINKAGSLRMQVFRITTALMRYEAAPDQAPLVEDEIREFNRRLRSAALLDAIPTRSEHPFRMAYSRVEQRWEQRMQSVFTQALNQPDMLRAPGFLQEVEQFYGEIDTLVIRLQQGAETRILMLRLVQGMAIFLTFGLIFFAMHLVYTRVVMPLRELLEAARRAQDGDLTARVSYTSPDEIGLLGSTFNTMAGNLEEHQRHLTREVQEKTSSLQQSNQALRLMFETSQNLGAESLSQATVECVLENLAHASSADRVRLVLNRETVQQLLGLTDLNDGSQEHAELRVEGTTGIPDAGSRCRQGTANAPALATVPVREDGHEFGMLIVEYDRRLTPSPWLVRLAEAVADQLGVALARAARYRQERRLALMEERSVIARELHDSLAQSLSYLKIQAMRLQRLNENNPEGAVMAPVLAELREGLNESYRHLRQLLSSFRLQMNDQGLEQALQAAALEFGKRGGITVDLDLSLKRGPLDSNAELHVLHVTREALANVVQHARASKARICFRQERDGHCRLTVDDDGVGIPEQFEKVNHYGTRIMQERATSLNGRLSIGASPLGGTRVDMRFTCAKPDITTQASP